MTALEIYVYFGIPFAGLTGCLIFLGYAAGKRRSRTRARARAAARRADALLDGQNFPRMAVDNTTSAA